MDNDDVERELDELEKRMAHYKIKREPEAVIYWTYYKDGRVETNFIHGDKPKITQETPLDERISEAPQKSARKQLTCKRCNRSWTQRGRKPPIQCPKCKSPYWNRKRRYM
jgi:rubrerythrin